MSHIFGCCSNPELSHGKDAQGVYPSGTYCLNCGFSLSKGVEIASESDREWFEQNPDETERIRDMIPGEFPPDAIGDAKHVLVTQVGPGFRTRRPMTLFTREELEKLVELGELEVTEQTPRPEQTPHPIVPKLFEGQAEGAIPNGTRIYKCNSESDEAHQDGSRGVVVGSMLATHGPRANELYIYSVFWDDLNIPYTITGDQLTTVNPQTLPSLTGTSEHTNTMNKEPVVKIYKDQSQGGNGAFAVSTTASESDEFLRECAIELELVSTELVGDLEFTYNALLPQICELWAKLRGYKADAVYEHKILVIGEPHPEAHMTLLNSHAPTAPARQSVKK